MKYAVDSEQMKSIDNYTVQEMKVPASVLMERAAEAVVSVMKSRIALSDRILVVCGPGNNGGDGIAAGRILYLQGYDVAILFLGEESKARELMKSQMEIAKNLGIRIENSNKLTEYNIIIDSIFGVGLSREVTGVYEEIILRINEGKHRVFSVDVPSGICADSGKVMRAAVKADYTITFGYQKIGLLLYPGAEYAGSITVADIGFPAAAAIPAKLNTFYYEPEDLHRLPIRKNDSHKGTYGKVLIIAGSEGMSGAAYLSAMAAYRTGAGLVKVITAKANRIILQTLLPEALFEAYDDEGISELQGNVRLEDNLAWATAVVIGPGLGMSPTAASLLEAVIKKSKTPLIVDADGINLLPKLLEDKMTTLASFLQEQTILTPHLKELSRLTKRTLSDITHNLIDTVEQCSYNNKLIYAVKSARTMVAYDRSCYINVSGNHGMATGGSGDILTGIIAGLIAQGMEPYEATCLAVYIHGLAGDAAAEEKGPYSMIARDIMNGIEKVFKQISIEST